MPSDQSLRKCLGYDTLRSQELWWAGNNSYGILYPPLRRQIVSLRVPSDASLLYATYPVFFTRPHHGYARIRGASGRLQTLRMRELLVF